MNENYQRAVIGTGPGGSQAALVAAKKGFKVVVIEMQSGRRGEQGRRGEVKRGYRVGARGVCGRLSNSDDFARIPRASPNLSATHVNIPRVIAEKIAKE